MPEQESGITAPFEASTEWITAKDLMIAADGQVPRYPTLKSKAICRWAHAGLMRTRAKLQRIDGVDRSNEVLPKTFWWTEGERALNQDWESGDFSWSSSSQQAAAFGVQFARQDAEALGVHFGNVGPKANRTPGSPTVGSNNRGGRKRSAIWADFVAELCSYFIDKGVPPGSGTEGAEAVIAAVDTRLIERGFADTLARSTTQPVVNAALIRLRAEN